MSKRAPMILFAMLAALALGLAACGGDDGDDEPTLDQATVTENLENAGYEVVEAVPGEYQLPGLVDDVSFATGPDTGFQGAIQVSGNGLAPFDPTDLSETGFAFFYETADQAAQVDDSIGSGEGQNQEGNVLFIYGGGVDPAPEEFDDMIDAAEGD